MKLFGKKTLALILALSMVMSVCVFAENATASVTVGATTTLEAPSEAGEATVTWTSGDTNKATVDGGVVTGVAAGEVTITATWTPEGGTEQSKAWTVTVNPVAVTGVTISGDSSVNVGAEITLTATVSPAEATNKSVTWVSNDDTIATVSASGVVKGVKEGSATITVTTEDGSKTDTHAVTVVKKAISVSAVTVEVPAGASAAFIKNKLPGSVETADNITLTKGTDFGEWTANSDGTAYTAELTDAAKAKYELTGTITANISAKTTWPLADLAVVGVANDDDEPVGGLTTAIRDALVSIYGGTISTSDITFSFANGSNGDVYNKNYYVDNDELDTLFQYGYLTDDITYTATYGTTTFSGKIDITVYTTYISDTFSYTGGSLKDIKDGINTRLNALHGRNLDSIYFDSIELDGGLLYTDSTCDYEIDDDSYSASALADMWYLPDGSGEASAIKYYAYTSSSSDDAMIGYIYLEADDFILLTAEIGSGDTLDFDADDILDAIYEANDEFDVVHVRFTKLPDSSDGVLYHEYEEDDTSPAKVVKNKSYYVEPEGTQAGLSNFTYIPKKTASGPAVIEFVAYKTTSTSTSSSNRITGVIRVNVIEEADITVAVGKGESIAFDLDWFYDIVKEYASTSAKKKYEIAYIVFDNAPGSKSEGYLYVDGDKLTNPDGDKFYAYDSDDGDYDFDDLTFVGGNTAKTTHSTFSVYGRPSDSNSKPVVLVSNRTIDFVVGSSHSINNAQSPMKAAQVLNFYNELDAFESLGDNDNVYVEFTSLPKGGKLYYNYGMSTQKDVTVGTEYYITSASGKQLLRNVTFVPSYSADKIAKTISWGIKGYDKNGKSVTGTVDISVTYAYSSLYFSDISGSLYADSVDFLKNRGITTGVPGGKYDAAGQLSRAELVTFLYRAAGSPAVYGTSKFTDVPTNEYFYKAVLWATQNGITKGTNAAGTLFSPYAKVTNQEIIQFMYNYDVNYLKHTSYVAGSSSHVYDYNKVADWAQVAVKWAVGKSVLTPGLLNPTTVGIRGDIALYLHRMLTL